MSENGTPTGAGYGAPKTVLFNQDEQILSSKINNLQLFAGAELTDVIARLTGIDQAGFTGSFVPSQYGILTGFEPTIAGFTFGAYGGLGFTSNVPASNPADASNFQWIKSTGLQTIALTPNTNPSNPLWALVYAQSNSAQSAAAAAAQWNPALNGGAGGVQTASLNQRQDPGATLGILYGSAASSPTPPSLSAALGAVPIAFVLMPASSGTPTTANVYDARPILAPGSYGANGVVTGMHLLYTPGSTVVITGGRAYATGCMIQMDNSFATPIAFSTLVSSPAANTVYYLYAVPVSAGGLPIVSLTDQSYNNTPTSRPGSGFQLVASTITPTATGNPSSALTFTPGYGTTSGTVTTGSVNGKYTAIFLGSVCTDKNSALIPFRRNGDQVLLFPPQSPFSVSGLAGSQLDGGAAVGYNSGNPYVNFPSSSGSYPIQETLTFPGTSSSNNQVPIPATATSGIFDIFFGGLSASGNASIALHVQDAASHSLSGSTRAVAATGFLQLESTTNVTSFRAEVEPASGTTLTFVMDTNSSGTSITVAAILRGYVEPRNQTSGA